MHLEVVDRSACDSGDGSVTLQGRVLEVLEAAEPLTRGALRERLSVKNERLGPVITELQREGVIERTSEGWRRAATESPPSVVPRSPL